TRFALAFDADSRSRFHGRFQLCIQLARTGEVDRDAREPGVLEPLQLAERNNPEAVYISPKKLEQRLVRICSNGIMQADPVGHSAFEARDLRPNDIVVVNEERRAAGFGD